MGRNIIYTVKVGRTTPSCEEILDWGSGACPDYVDCERLRKEINEYQDANEWGKITMKQMQWYAEKTNSDLMVLGKDDLELIDPPSYLSWWVKTAWLKFSVLEHFVRSDYEKFLFLDLDIYIRPTAENIFETLKEPGLHMSYDGNPKHTHLIKSFLDTDIMHNSGVIYADRPSIQELYSYVPKENEWDSFLNRRETNDQVILSYLIQKHKMKTNLLNYKLWNMPWDFQEDQTHFVHYYGAIGKSMLRRLWFLNEECSVNKISIKL